VVEHNRELVERRGAHPVLALMARRLHAVPNVFPYPDEGPARWFPVVAFGWLLLVICVLLPVPGLAHRMSAAFRRLDESP
jgi:hypothetical protein